MILLFKFKGIGQIFFIKIKPNTFNVFLFSADWKLFVDWAIDWCHYPTLYWRSGVKYFRKLYHYVLGWANFSKSSQIKPLFLYSICMGKIRSHAKFQVSSSKDLTWPPLFVNQSWHWESHLKWPESGTFDLVPFIGIKNALQNGITLGFLAFRKYLKRLKENW